LIGRLLRLLLLGLGLMIEARGQQQRSLLLAADLIGSRQPQPLLQHSARRGMAAPVLQKAAHK